MIPINRETLLTIATIICAIGVIYLFKEMNKTREEMNSFKTFSTEVVKKLNAPAPAPEPEPEPEPEPVNDKPVE
tara:strand:+ start:1154 stop:1375 length:222 start_codon:yes stop_codon:yes gene_type:complete